MSSMPSGLSAAPGESSPPPPPPPPRASTSLSDAGVLHNDSTDSSGVSNVSEATSLVGNIGGGARVGTPVGASVENLESEDVRTKPMTLTEDVLETPDETEKEKEKENETKVKFVKTENMSSMPSGLSA